MGCREKEGVGLERMVEHHGVRMTSRDRDVNLKERVLVVWIVT
jgi:hypothetical protein